VAGENVERHGKRNWQSELAIGIGDWSWRVEDEVMPGEDRKRYVEDMKRNPRAEGTS
jgi:hypothetical protein